MRRLRVRDGSGRDSAPSQTLAAEQADLNLGLVQPTAISGCVVRSEPVPYPATDLLSEGVGEGITAVRTQVIDHQMDGLCPGIVRSDLHQVVGESR